jgi:hypothetical protein
MTAAVPPNADIVNGFRPVGTLSGSDYHGKLRRVSFAAGDSTACFIGDLVKLTANTDAAGTTPVVTQSGVGDISVGVLVSLEPNTDDEGSLSAANYRTASTKRYGQVCFGSDVLYSIQEDSVGNSMPITDAGLNADVIIAAGNTVTGASGMEIDSTTAATTNTLALRLHHVENRVGNKLGDNANWIVSINLSDDRATTGVS